MSSRAYFLITAISGMIGMLSLITLSLCKYWFRENPMRKLSDEGIDELINIASVMAISFHVSKASIVTFLVFFVLYFISLKNKPKTNDKSFQ